MESTSIGKSERITQNRIIELFQRSCIMITSATGKTRSVLSPLRKSCFTAFLLRNKAILIRWPVKAIDKLVNAAGNLHNGLYEANKQTYHMLRYGVSITEEAGQISDRVWFINWSEPNKNDFGIAEEVTVTGKFEKRPDIVFICEWYSNRSSGAEAEQGGCNRRYTAKPRQPEA